MKISSSLLFSCHFSTPNFNILPSLFIYSFLFIINYLSNLSVSPSFLPPEKNSKRVCFILPSSCSYSYSFIQWRIFYSLFRVLFYLGLFHYFPTFFLFQKNPKEEEEMESEDYRRKERVALLVSLIMASLSMASLLVAFSYYCYIRNKVSKRSNLQQRLDNDDKSRLSNSSVQVACEKGLQVFTFKQLNSATNGFSKSNIIGQGAFGSVYRGILNDGRKVAIKLMDHGGKHGEEEFKMEVELLGRLSSPYLLGLVGHCSDSNHRLLVYEFMANGGLQEHMYPGEGSNAFPSKLDWETRLRIALDAAKGLEYLHEHVSPPVIHRDFKSSNILLDKSFHAKVSDFGLAKLGPEKAGGHVSTRVLGTQGYVAPEYALTGHLTTKSDVYSYGIVLLELLTGRVPVDMKRPQGEGVLVSWALPRLTDRERVVQIMDPALEGQYTMKDVIQVAAIAAMCVQPEADYRPLMADVVQSLVPLVKLHKSSSKVGSGSSFHAPKSPADSSSKCSDTES